MPLRTKTKKQLGNLNFLLPCIRQFSFLVSGFVVSCVDPAGNVSWMLFPGGTELRTQVKMGSREAAHTLNNPQVECTRVLLCVSRE